MLYWLKEYVSEKNIFCNLFSMVPEMLSLKDCPESQWNIDVFETKKNRQNRCPIKLLSILYRDVATKLLLKWSSNILNIL